jgi:hypothetical protein
VTILADRPPNWSAVPSTLSVAVFAPRDVTESLAIRVFDEAKAIWGPTGIALDWHRVTSGHMAVGYDVTVMIDDDQKDSGEGALGWIPFTADGPASSIHLSRANAEELIRRTPGLTDATIVGHEILVGRALGRALSHELGHYLLKSKVHTPHGLMRATWASSELLSIDRRGFELTAEQRAAAELIPVGRAG